MGIRILRAVPGLNVHLYPSDFTAESRILKITEAVTAEGIFDRVLMLGTWREGLPRRVQVDARREIRRLGRSKAEGGLLNKVRGTLGWYLAVWRELRGEQVACVNCHSLPILPLCIALKWRHRALLVYDTHELETETTMSRGIRRPVQKILERVCMPFVDATFVVGRRIAEWYRRAYGIDACVIRNMPRRVPADAKPSPLRAACGIPDDAIVYLYLGIVAPGRGLEDTMEVFRGLPDRYVVFMGNGPGVPSVEAAGRTHPNIRHMPAVPPEDVAAVARGADVGIWLQKIECLSYAYACPNKFFEYIQAGLPVVVVDDAIELRDLIRERRLGWTVPHQAAQAAEVLRGIGPREIATAREAVRAVQPEMHWDIERERLVRAYRGIVGARDG
jgi:glycosyltransferase involved in cell wall biosynthesis